jgi:hypothetical protein
MNKSPKVKNIEENIEVWEDLVRIEDLVLALIICSVLALGGYLIAPNDPPKPLFFGLSGAFIGFVLSAFLIKPKRDLREVDLED